MSVVKLVGILPTNLTAGVGLMADIDIIVHSGKNLHLFGRDELQPLRAWSAATPGECPYASIPLAALLYLLLQPHDPPPLVQHASPQERSLRAQRCAWKRRPALRPVLQQSMQDRRNVRPPDGRLWSSLSRSRPAGGRLCVWASSGGSGGCNC